MKKRSSLNSPIFSLAQARIENDNSSLIFAVWTIQTKRKTDGNIDNAPNKKEFKINSCQIKSKNRQSRTAQTKQTKQRNRDQFSLQNVFASTAVCRLNDSNQTKNEPIDRSIFR